MRVLILSWEYPPLIEGGLARHVRKLAENLIDQDVEVHVLARGLEESPAEEEVDGVLVHRVREPERPRGLSEFVTWIEHMNADMLAAGVEVGDRYDFDVVHGHDWLVAVAGDHLAKRFRCPFVVTIHATEYGRHQGWVDKHPQSHIHGVERWMANRAEQVITCSAYMREHVADIYGLEESRIAVIPNGIDPSELVPVDDLDTLRSRFAEPEERLVLLVGRLVYEKGFQLALEALPGVIERLGDVRFVVAGSGTAEADLRRQASELGLDPYGTFLGWIGDDVLHSLYRIADLTVVPSLYEPFGLVALEAMASGCPCIVADTGGLREIVPANDRVGLRFNGGDPEHLATMVERLLTDAPLRDRLVAEASEHVLSFDWADVAKQVAAIYRDPALGSGPLKTAAVIAAALSLTPIHAHRGGSVLDGEPRFAENTMPAFRNASRAGYVLELDVKLTSDRVPVVIHDATLDRTTACTGEVASKTLAQVRACPTDVLGSPGNGLPTRVVAPKEPIPTLAEVLAFARREGAFVNMEIKNQPTDPDFDPGTGFTDTVMAAVAASGFPRARLIVQSFWPPNLTAAKARLPGVETSFLTLAQANDGGPAFAQASGHQWVSPAWPVSPAFVADAKGRGLRVVPYTLNEVAEYRAARAAGVDALITDDPVLAARVLGLSRKELAPDPLEPTARIRAPRYASDDGRRSRFRVRLAATDRGSGVAGLRLQFRRNTDASTRWLPVLRETQARFVYFRGRPGRTYLFRLRARDRLGNFSPYVYARTTVPLDDRSRRLRFTGNWARSRSRLAYEGTLRRPLRPGAAMTLRFRGTRVALVAPRSLAGGLVRVRLDGRTRLVSLRGDAIARRVVFRSKLLRPGVHRLQVTSLGGGRVAVDAVAFEQGPNGIRRR